MNRWRSGLRGLVHRYPVHDPLRETAAITDVAPYRDSIPILELYRLLMKHGMSPATITTVPKYFIAPDEARLMAGRSQKCLQTAQDCCTDEANQKENGDEKQDIGGGDH